MKPAPCVILDTTRGFLMILAIDQSYSGTGVCYISSDGRIETGLIKTRNDMPWESRIDTIISGLDRFFDLSTIQMDKPSPVEHIVIESYAFSRATSSVFQLGELGGIIKYHFHCLGVDVDTMLIAYPKMFIAMNGQADKKDVIKGLKTKLDIEVKDDNVADSIAIGWTYYNWLMGQSENEELAPYYRVVLRKVGNYLGKKTDNKPVARIKKVKIKKERNVNVMRIKPENF